MSCQSVGVEWNLEEDFSLFGGRSNSRRRVVVVVVVVVAGGVTVTVALIGGNSLQSSKKDGLQGAMTISSLKQVVEQLLSKESEVRVFCVLCFVFLQASKDQALENSGWVCRVCRQVEEQVEFLDTCACLVASAGALDVEIKKGEV